MPSEPFPAPATEVLPGGRMISTGIAPLDARLGGLVSGRHYLLSGPPGSGKSSAALQFLGRGLNDGETCLLLTQDDPNDILCQGEFLGFDLRTAAARERLVVLQYRLDFARNYARSAEPARVFDELRAALAEFRPSRFAIDSLSPFLEGGMVAEEALSALPAFLSELDCTTYLTVPGDLGEPNLTRLYDRVINSAAGIFHLAPVEAHVRELVIRKVRQPVKSTESLRFVLRPGIGIVEHVATRPEVVLPPEIRRRVLLLQGAEGAELPEEVAAALEHSYDLHRYRTVEQAFAELSGARFGALLIELDPRESERIFQLTRELRRAGNGAPILFVAPHQGLRGSTRARGLRAGGDDFLTDALSPEEFLERIQVACERGHRRSVADFELEPLFLQPRGEDGAVSLLDEATFRDVLARKLRGTANPFFALVVLRPTGISSGDAWHICQQNLRIAEGDLGARLDDGPIALYLHDVRRRSVEPLLRRITAAHPEMGTVEAMDVFTYPSDRAEIESWAGVLDTSSARVA
jgi:KaiC/GvpD/RAD55 family RecA-like ATPase/CheY-like chemotaxis protein